MAIVDNYPFGPDVPVDFQNHINTMGDAIRELQDLPSGAAGGDAVEVADGNTGRVTVDGALTRYLYRYIHYRITSDAAGTTLVDPTSYTGSTIYVGVNNSNQVMAAADAAYQYQAFMWGSGYNLGYQVSGYGNFQALTQTSALPGNAAAIDNSTGTIDTQITIAEGEPGTAADIYRPVRLYQNSASSPAGPAATDGFNSNTGQAVTTGDWAVSPSAPPSGQLTWKAEFQIVQSEGAGLWAGAEAAWSVVQSTGERGETGSGGRGAAFIRIPRSGTLPGSVPVPTTAEVNTATGTTLGPIRGDVAVVIYSDGSRSFSYDGTNWTGAAQTISGDLVVDGTIGTAKITANAITTNEIAADAVTATQMSVFGTAGGNRIEFFGDRIEVYNGATLRLRIGNLNPGG